MQPAHDGAHLRALGQAHLVDAPAGEAAGLVVAPHDGLQRLGGASAQAVHGLDVAAPHIGQQLADDRVAGADGDVDGSALHQVGIGAPVDDRQHALGAQPLGQQARHDVVLVVARQADEEIHVVHVLVAEQLLVGGVAVEHQHARAELRAQVLAALAVGLDHLQLQLLLHLARQAQADLAAAGHHQPLHGPVALAQRAQHGADVLGGGEHEDFVAGLDARGAVEHRHHGVLPVDGHDAHVHARHQVRDLGQRVLHQRPAGHRAHRDQAHQAVRELQHLQRLGVLDELADVGRHRLLGADQLVDREALAVHQLAAVDELGAAHARDGGRHVEAQLGHLAGHQVGLVQRRAGDQQVGVLDAGFLEHAGLHAVAGHGAQVQPLLQLGQTGDVGVDDGDVVLLGHQALGHALAHAARAQDQDLHGARV